MIEELKPYREYSDSGLKWLGKVPAHWEMEPGFAAFRQNKKKNTGMVEKRVLSLSYGRIIIKPEEKLRGLVPESFETYQIVEPGDIIIRSTDLQNDVTSLRVGIVRDRGIITSAYLCLKMVGPLTPDYSFLQLHTLDLKKVFYGLGSGLRQNLGFSDFKRLPIIIPPRAEQDAIVRFLSHAHRRIEGFIRAKGKLIALLNEQKQAIIHRAVTRGLDPNARLKPSGVSWLGDVPEHWRGVKLSQVTTKIGDGLHGTPQYVDGSPYHFVNGNNLINGAIKIKPSTKCVSKNEYNKYWIALNESTLLMSINGTIGNVAIYRGESVILGKSAAYINCGSSITREFLFFVLQSPSVKSFFEREATGTTILNLSLASIGRFSFSLPPLAEQSQISSFLSASTSEVDELIDRVKQEIALIKEYRTRLTADVVTGQLDVRAAASQLPDEADEAAATNAGVLPPCDEDEMPDDEIEDA